MSQGVVIGHWTEKQSRDLTRCPSYYAADTETIRTKPGKYTVTLVFEGGYTVPMPYWLCCGIDGDRIDGRLYSGFGGVNFASTKLPKEPTVYHVQTYAYYAKDLVEKGILTLLPGFEWLLTECAWRDERAPKTWEQVMELATRKH